MAVKVTPVPSAESHPAQKSKPVGEINSALNCDVFRRLFADKKISFICSDLEVKLKANLEPGVRLVLSLCTDSTDLIYGFSHDPWE